MCANFMTRLGQDLWSITSKQETRFMVLQKSEWASGIWPEILKFIKYGFMVLQKVNRVSIRGNKSLTYGISQAKSQAAELAYFS